MKKLFYCVLILLAAGCKERYDSPVHSPVTGYLVIDGVINSGPGTASLTLSRTTKFNNRDIVYETGAAVTIQGQDSSTRTLGEQGPGVYTGDNLIFDNNVKYRLRITVSGGEEYISDFVAVKNDPPIDSVSWKLENGGVQLYINTHDPLNNTRYYQWVYDETWEFHSAFLSYLKYKITPNSIKGDQYSVVYRDSTTFSYDPDIVTCWQFNTPTDLFLGSTAKLSQDIVQLPLAFIPQASIKLGVLYSLHVKQYSWPEAGYEFLENMKKNTESTGTIFDPQPSELKGNIRSVTNANEPVIGYFNICPVQEKRIFINNSDVPGWGYKSDCIASIIENNNDSIVKKALGLYPAGVDTQGPFGGILTFTASAPECVDCTLSGTNRKPAYWP
jgi:Domain of unknown function (DUF4249)